MGWFVRQCHLSPTEVDAMGWLDLVALTLVADDELAAAEKRSREANRAKSTGFRY